MARSWPGNVRELENVLTRAAVLSQGDMLLEEHLVEATRPAVPRPATDGNSSPAQIPTLDDVERAHIERVFAMTKGHKGRTCQILGISRPTLERKLRKYGLTAAER